MFLRFLLLFLFFNTNAKSLENCNWNNQKGTPCVTITKTTNTSSYNKQGVKKIFNKQYIVETGATSALDLLKKVSGIDFYQSGQKGQQASIFIKAQNQITHLYC